jgi:hypothetical protein
MRHLAPRGKATIFPGSETVKLRDVTDGTSNTINLPRAGSKRGQVGFSHKVAISTVASARIGAGLSQSQFADSSCSAYWSR